MGGFLKKLTGFTVAAAVVYVAVIAVMANTLDPVLVNGQPVTNVPLNRPDGGLSVLRFRDAETHPPVDVVFMGSSHCYRTFDTAWYRTQGLTAFNLGSSAQGPVITYHLAGHYLDRLDPDLVVLEVYCETLRGKGVESLVDQISNRPLAPDLLAMAASVRSVKGWNCLLARRLDFRSEPVSERVPEFRPENGRYVPGGFVRRDLLHGGLPSYAGDRAGLDPRQMRYLDKLITRVRNQGRRIVLVSQPLPPRTLAAITDYAAVQAAVQAVADRHGIPFYDFNGLVNETGPRDLHDPALFFDYHHFNPVGVAAFNPVFLDRLRADGWLSAVEN